MRQFKVISHRRSGTHFLWNTLNSNFDLTKPDSPEGDMGGFKWHRSYRHTPESFIKNHNCVFLVRDPRDTLVSIWHYWHRGAEASLKMKSFLKGKTFSQYIRGCSLEDIRGFFVGFNENEIDAGHYLDPVQHWIDYAEWSDHVYTVRYEDIKESYVEVVNAFGVEFNLKPKHNIPKQVSGLVGHFPRKGVVGDWQNFFTEEDNEYVIEKAREYMTKFNYI